MSLDGPGLPVFERRVLAERSNFPPERLAAFAGAENVWPALAAALNAAVPREGKPPASVEPLAA